MTGFPQDDRDPFTDGWPDRDEIIRKYPPDDQNRAQDVPGATNNTSGHHSIHRRVSKRFPEGEPIMSSHRIQPEPRVVIRRFMTHVIAQLKPLVPIIQKAMEAKREADRRIVLWSPDPPSVPAGHVWTLPGVGTSKIDRAIWWGEPGNLRDNATVACLANARLYEPIPGWKPPTPTRVRIFDRDGALIGESGEPELITSQSAEDQRAHEEDADD